MEWKKFIRIFGLLLLLSSVVLIISSIESLISWILRNGFLYEFELFIVGPIIAVAFLPLGLIYFFIPGEKIGKLLKTSSILALSVILINISYYGFLFLMDKIVDVLGFALLYIFLLFPISLIALVVSIIFAFIAFFKKTNSSFAFPIKIV